MREYERLVLESRPALAGKVCWSTATYFYNEGLSAARAAAKFVQHTDREVNIGNWNRSQITRLSRRRHTATPFFDDGRTNESCIHRAKQA
jgi:hypothetical protein